MEIKAFPKIWAMGTRHVRDIFDGEVEITEKVDGSQFAFGRLDGELQMRSKGKVIVIDAPDKMFQRAVDYVISIESFVPDNMVFYCEYLQKPKHNVLCYDRTPLNNLALFGVSDADRDWMESKHSILKSWGDTLGIDTVPLLLTGRVNAQQAMELIELDSMLGGVKIEGVVVKSYKEMWIADQLLPITSAKYVSEAFKEVHRTNWKGENTGKGKWEIFIEGYRTDARWEKAIQHLQESGVLFGEPRDIGALIKEVQRDIQEECRDEILDFLYKTFAGDLTRKATQGLPEWYKKRIALQ